MIPNGANRKQHIMSITPPMARFAEVLTPQEVAKILKVTPATVRNMIKRGDLDAIQLKGGRGIYRVPSSALQRLMGTSDLAPESRSVFENINN